MELLEILSWIMLIPAFIGSFMMSSRMPDRKTVYYSNLLFTITNIFSIVFMIWNFHIGYLVMYIYYLGIGIRGMVLNRHTRKDETWEERRERLLKLKLP